MEIALVGNPNAGKSSVLNRITGSKVFASNYAGTSMEIMKANLNLSGENINIFDTPGIYSIYSDSEESKITRSLLEKGNVDLLVHVIDAGNLERNLVLSYELIELDYPMLILINQVDRSRNMGINIDAQALAHELGVPVLAFSATTSEGVSEFIEYIKNIKDKPDSPKKVFMDKNKARKIVLEEPYGCSGNCGKCSIRVETCMTQLDIQRAEKAKSTAEKVSSVGSLVQKQWLNRIQHLIDQPILGTVVLLVLAYLSLVILTKFIGLSEGPISALLQPVSQVLEQFILSIMPVGFLGTVISKAVPEGLIIPFTIIMPAMLMVSLLMALLEDTGLLPRYSVALERFGHLFGLSGQAVIPLSLGFGCRTPAVIATRVMPNDAQRFITITLLSIVIPCAATIGVLLMVTAKFHAHLSVIVVTMVVVMVLLGLLLSRLMPQEEAFIYELPPLRVPLAKNVWTKVKVRFSGFFTEVLPLLLAMSIGIRALMESGLLEVFQSMESFTHLVFGIPAEAFVAVLITIFQRYLAPLVLLNLSLTPREATIALSMIALSLPCLPVMVMTVKELGGKSLVKILLMGFTTSAIVGIVLNLILPI